ncbi:PTS sugar transporter subunit IIA [Virgibacillus sp. Bac330]|uniref:PTS sugar transporter subunit IIA n=1 Tax=Virgibacillus sp. Bac330 TaxID=2419841 RepID=UPI000EF4AD38|nr:PTS sugar transporter subunit IIA [Virgibacillus sp. Bac330]
MMFFNKEIITFNFEGHSKEQVLSHLSAEFIENDLVTQDFYASIISRELSFPTGLWMNDTGIAIPHTDSEKVKQAQIGFMSLKQPVTFKEMANKDNEIEVSLIFMLALKQSDQQLSMLQKLVNLFQNESMVKQLKECTSLIEFKSIMKNAGIE